MRFAINVPNFGAFSDVRALAQLAHEAEEAGWDGFFLWDHIGSDWPTPVADPWVALAAMAMTTQRITLAPVVTPLPRRRPWKLAREVVTLDHLSNGRVILGVGIGSDFGREFSAYGEPADDKTHGAMLDEGLDVLLGLWSGETFSYQGAHYTIHDARYTPTPLQEPRIPIWVAGVWPNKRPFQRAARWDGVVPLIRDEQREERPVMPDDVRVMLAYIHEQRTSAEPFDMVVAGFTGAMEPAAATALLDEYAAAGVTWWQEGFLPPDPIEAVHERIQAGPPRTSDR
ncbi:MAG TPA: LLM class flavin-dependent oxidoreductase [Ktedonobacterales bacterium]|nr:LLM class flavin-dependent oxidoreductase [Ktedonobacterales bacterium]